MTTLLIIIAFVLFWIFFGWVVTLLMCVFDDGIRRDLRGDDEAVLVYSVCWPLPLVGFLFTRAFSLFKFLNPADFVESMRERRERKQNVVVKSRRFRGKEDK